jgi:two-component system, OmpR family, sensor kinase
LTKVIDNIIDNGVKYSHNSKNIVIKIAENSLSIEDFGIGMDEVEIVKIFDQFYQANSTMKGFGIGLNMVKRFCDENDIALTLNSSLNVGTKVELKFKRK